MILSEKLQVGQDHGFIVNYLSDYMLFFPLKRAIFRISKRACDILTSSYDATVIKEALLYRITKALSAIDKEHISAIPQTDEDQNVLGIALTSSCNLRCTYCHANAGSESKDIDEQLIYSSIDHVTGWCIENKKEFYLVFTGSGEPTSNWEGLTSAIKYSRNICILNNIPIHISMATNGVYDQKKREYIANNFTRVTLSIDGPKEIHDRNRLTVNGEGSFNVAIKTASYLYERGFPFRIRSTISQQHVNSILDIYEFFTAKYPGVTVAFEPLNPIGRGMDPSNSPPSEKEFAEGYLAVLDKYGPNHISNSAIPSILKLRDRFCSPVARPNMNISVDGTIHSCSRSGTSKQFIFGKYDDSENKFIFDDDKINNFSQINVDDFPECSDCFARYHCAGDCHDLRDVGFKRCNTNKIILWGLMSHAVVNQNKGERNGKQGNTNTRECV